MEVVAGKVVVGSEVGVGDDKNKEGGVVREIHDEKWESSDTCRESDKVVNVWRGGLEKETYMEKNVG